MAAGGLPVIPGSSCPPAAASLGAAGLGPVCQVASGVTGVAGSAASQLAGFGVGSVLNSLGSWVSDGATWLLAQIGAVIANTTGIDLGASWFTAHYQIMAALAGIVIVPLLLLGIMQSIYRQNVSMLTRSVVVNVPLAILLTAVAVKLVQLGLAITDAMSAAVAQGAGLDTGHFLTSVTAGLSGPSADGQPAVPAFMLFLGGLAVVAGALMVWIELLIRAAAVYVAVLFLPLALASLAWPAIAHWCRRLVDTLVALILGKFVIVSVLSLAAGALAGGTGTAPVGGSASTAGSAGPTGSASSGGGFAAVLGGAALLLFAAFAPWALFRLLPFLEAGAVGHLEALGHRARHSAGAPVRGLAQTAMRATVVGSLAGTAAGSLGGLAAGSATRAGTGRGGRTGSGAGAGSGGGIGLGVGSVPGGDGPPGSRPDPEPSSAESIGVGTMESPGHGIPAWGIHPEATATARRFMDDQPGEGGEGTSRLSAVSAMSTQALSTAAKSTPAMSTPAMSTPAVTGAAGADAVKPLPRQTGALLPDALGRDELGVRLVAAPTTSARPPNPKGTGSHDAGDSHGR
jgi:hypothetical protein